MTNRNLLALILLIVFTLTGCQTAAVPAPAPEAAPTATPQSAQYLTSHSLVAMSPTLTADGILRMLP